MTVIFRTTADLLAERDRLLADLHTLRSLPTRAELLSRLADVRYLLGEHDGGEEP